MNARPRKADTCDKEKNVMDSNMRLKDGISQHLKRSGMDLVNKMTSLGYLSLASETRESLDSESHSIINLSSLSTEPGCITFSHLVEKIEKLVQLSGRLTLDSLTQKCMVDISYIEQAVEAQQNKQKHNGDTSLFLKVGNEVLSSSYMDGLINNLNARLNSSSLGRLLVSDVAINIFHLPLEVTTEVILDRVSMLQGIFCSNRKEILSYSYESIIQAQIRGVMQAISVPATLSTLQTRYNWPIAISTSSGSTPLSQYLSQMCIEIPFPGEFNATNDIYTPYVYFKQQKNAVFQFFSANGYITESQGQSLGLTTGGGKMLEYIRKLYSKPDDTYAETDANQKYTVVEAPVSKVVFQPDRVLSALEGVLISECLPKRSFMDMRMHLPDGFMSACEDESDIQYIINMCQSSNFENEKETPNSESTMGNAIVFSHGEALYISPGMVQDINEKIIPPLVDSYAKHKAKEMDTFATTSSQTPMKHEESSNMEVVITNSSSNAKGKKSGKKGKVTKSKRDNENTSAPSSSNSTKQKRLSAKEKRRLKGKESELSYHNNAGIIPLLTISLSIAKEYPELLEIQNTVNDVDLATITSPPWKTEKEDELLFQFTRTVVSYPKMRQLCEKAVHLEYENIQQNKRLTTKTDASNNRHKNANLSRNIEESFEDPLCFANACYLVQIMKKSVTSIKDFTQSKETFQDIDAIVFEKMLLRCASHFARRITEYCLFKYGIEEGIFSFKALESRNNNVKEDVHDSRLPPFCLPVNMGITEFSTMFLSLGSRNENSQKKDVLQTIRDEFPKEVGVAIARMWVYCGGESYEGGIKTNDDGEGGSYVRPGSIEGFLNHVEEYCLSMCGLPFKILDKKSEKQAMFARRMALKQSLEQIQNQTEILDVTIIILFQQVKHLAVAGSFVRTIVLNLLLKEKKIGTSVGENLNSLAKILDSDVEAEEDLVHLIKAYGLCKDISKFEKEKELSR